MCKCLYKYVFSLNVLSNKKKKPFQLKKILVTISIIPNLRVYDSKIKGLWYQTNGN